MIDLKRLNNSIAHAMRGVKVVFFSEQSFRIQVVVAVLVIIAACSVGLTSTEWIIILLLIGSVLTLEMVNSILERVVDTFKPRIHPVVKDIKDIMAGTVMLVSLIAAVVGLIIFCPHLLELKDQIQVYLF